tara:strand:+ start:313 stop:1701 length:1389 start_codon:yes stop_codon:yes gene_type:complete
MRICSDAVAISDKGLQFQGQSIYQDVQPLDLVHDDYTRDYFDMTIGGGVDEIDAFSIPVAEINDGAKPGVRFTLPPGICTAYPIEIEYDILVNNTSDNVITHLATKTPIIYNFIPTGSNKFPQPRSIAATGQIVSGSSSSPESIKNDFIISGSANYKIMKHKESFNVSDIFSGDMIITRLRDGTSSSSETALLLNARAKFLRFALGEYRNPAQPFTRGVAPGPPVLLVDEDWSNGFSGGTGIDSDGWETRQGSNTKNYWVIPEVSQLPNTSSKKFDPVDRAGGMTRACYITDNPGTATDGSDNQLNYNSSTSPVSQNFVCIFSHFEIPNGVQNISVTMSFTGQGENNFEEWDKAMMFILPSGSSAYSVSDLNGINGSYGQGPFTRDSANRIQSLFFEDGYLNGQGSNSGAINTFISGSFPVAQDAGWQANTKNILVLTWDNDSTGNPKSTSIGKIIINGSFT